MALGCFQTVLEYLQWGRPHTLSDLCPSAQSLAQCCYHAHFIDWLLCNNPCLYFFMHVKHVQAEKPLGCWRWCSLELSGMIKLTNQIMCSDWSELPAGWGRTCNEAGSKQEEQLLCLTHSFTQGPGGSRYPLDTGQRCLLRLLEAHHLSVNTESSPIMPFNTITWCDKTLTASCSSPSILLSSPLLCTPHFLPVLANKQLLQQYTF